MALYLGAQRIASGAISNGGANGYSDTTPVGTIVEYPSNTPPDNWLICDGSAISRNEFNDLFKVIGTSYGSGDGSTTFNLPNFKGRVPVGLDTTQEEFNTIGKPGGSKYMQKHNHNIRGEGQDSDVTLGNSVWGWSSGVVPMNGSNAGDHLITTETGEGDSGNLQPYIVANYIIKATKEISTSSVNEIYNAMWPIGRGFIDFTDIDYSNWLGFTWERELVGMVGVGLDTSQTEFNEVGKTGGEKTHKHLQTFGSNPTAIFAEVQTTTEVIHSGNKLVITNADNYVENHPSIILSNTYDSNSLPPYKVIAYWKRVA